MRARARAHARTHARTHAHTHTHTHTQVPALLTWQHSWYFIKIKYSEANISVRVSVSPLERDWSTKPTIYIINNSFAFRYVTSQIWKYYGIFGFVPNERGRILEHKAPFHKQLSAQAFKVYSLVSLCERRVQNQHMVTVWGLCFQVRNSWHSLFFCWRNQTALQYCGRPFWIGGELPVFVVRPHAPNRDVRTVTVQ